MQPSIAVALVQRHLPWRAAARDALLVAGGALLLSLLARIEIPLALSPVPISGQTAGVLLLGALLGSWRAGASVGLYLVEGLLGLPVFAGGALGLAVLAGPTGGYLLAFVPAACAIGWLVERGFDRSFLRCALALSIGAAIVLVFGALWLARFVGAEQALKLGVLPFLLVDALKIGVVALVLPALKKHV